MFLPIMNRTEDEVWFTSDTDIKKEDQILTSRKDQMPTSRIRYRHKKRDQIPSRNMIRNHPETDVRLKPNQC